MYCSVQFLSHTSVKLFQCHAVRGMTTEMPHASGLSFGTYLTAYAVSCLV